MTRAPLAAFALAALALGACVVPAPVSHAVVDVRVPPATGAVAAPAGVAKIVEVRDSHRFEAMSLDPSQPSLPGAGDVPEAASTRRVVAVNRNAYGHPMGVVVLSDGRAVSDLVYESARRALEEKGWAVAGPSSPDFARAVSLSLDVDHFWAWMTPGFSFITMNFVAVIELRGERLTGEPVSQAATSLTIESPTALEGDWEELVARGVADLTEAIREQLRTPAQVPR